MSKNSRSTSHPHPNPLPEGEGTKPFVSRAGQKLDHALNVFKINVHGKTCADLGSNTGGFVDCLLQRGAKKVYAIDTGYGVLDWKLRNDSRVIVMERTNAMHVELPEKIEIVTIDVAWTKQRNILPAAEKMLAENGKIITLIKPHYEAMSSQLRKGVLPEDQVDAVVKSVLEKLDEMGLMLVSITISPIKGTKGNVEHLALLMRRIEK
jgi:23S rRNA (cytidine1920-2'-O)/16S rRNA (cytidine1409-2'-O)-methyltransferase